MYKKFYSFREMPFSLVGDYAPNLVFLSQNYKMVLSALMGGLNKKASLIVVLGENGVGKTTFANYMCNHLQQDFSVRLIDVFFESTKDFFQQVLTSFDQKVKKVDTYEMLLQLSFFLSTQFKEQGGQPTLLIIDDADKMTVDVQKGIELLLGLNTEDSQILQLILIGQPKLESLLNASTLHDFFQNTRTQCLLEPLTENEAHQYIAHRIKMAGVHNKKLFDEQAYSVIYEYSEGVPATINWICDKSLEYGSKQDKEEISSKLIRDVINGEVGGLEKKNIPWMYSLALFTGVVFVGTVLIFFSPTKNISSSEGSKIELSSHSKKDQGKDESKNQKGVLEEIQQQIKSLDNLIKKEVLIAENKENEVEKIIETQLASAEQQITDSKWSSPKNDNAYETYLDILETYPSEQRALDGVQNIASNYLSQANKQRKQGKLEKSLLLVSKGLKISPKNEELLKLKERVGFDAKQTENQEEVNALYRQARKQIDRLQYTKPFNNNAYETYQSIVNLDENNLKAKQGILEILFHLKSQAQKSLIEEDYATATVLSEEIMAKGGSDPFYEKAIVAGTEIKIFVDHELKSLLNLADKQRKSLKLTEPFGDNAFESYNKALLIAPDNKDAIKGQKDLVRQYQQLVKAALFAGKIDRALIIVNEGLSAFPGNQRLLFLRRNAALQKDIALKEEAKEIAAAENKTEDQGKKMKSFGTF